jgi:SAM-dependent methyltransferase
MRNYYGNLCTQMYEILHPEAPKDELEFYFSYAEKNQKILEPLCGSGRFFVPFLEREYNITGIDLSGEMLEKLTQKVSNAKVTCTSIEDYKVKEKFDYIFISSGSVSLFTDMHVCKEILSKMYQLLKAGGKFVFAVDTVASICPDDDDYKVSINVKTKEGFDLILKTKNTYDPVNKIQYSPSIYELFDHGKLIQKEKMDFQTRLYELGELEHILKDIGFKKCTVYSTFSKDIALNNTAEMFLYECQGS